MLEELGALEQRTKAVYEVLDGASVTEVARRYGVCRQTVHEWLHKYANEGFSALVTRPLGPRLGRIRCRRSSKPASSRCVVHTRAGACARSVTGWLSAWRQQNDTQSQPAEQTHNTHARRSALTRWSEEGDAP